MSGVCGVLLVFPQHRHRLEIEVVPEVRVLIVSVMGIQNVPVYFLWVPTYKQPFRHQRVLIIYPLLGGETKLSKLKRKWKELDLL